MAMAAQTNAAMLETYTTDKFFKKMLKFSEKKSIFAGDKKNNQNKSQAVKNNRTFPKKSNSVDAVSSICQNCYLIFP
jgi:hypothetical protein